MSGDRIDESESSARDSIRRMRGIVADSDSIQKVHSFLFVFVRLRTQYCAKKIEYNNSHKHPYICLDASTVSVMTASTDPDSCTLEKNICGMGVVRCNVGNMIFISEF